MTMCPYKWFLYIASIWAVAYVMLETFMQYRATNSLIQKEGYEPVVADCSDSEDEDDDDIDATIDATVRGPGVTRQTLNVHH